MFLLQMPQKRWPRCAEWPTSAVPGFVDAGVLHWRACSRTQNAHTAERSEATTTPHRTGAGNAAYGVLAQQHQPGDAVGQRACAVAENTAVMIRARDLLLIPSSLTHSKRQYIATILNRVKYLSDLMHGDARKRADFRVDEFDALLWLLTFVVGPTLVTQLQDRFSIRDIPRGPRIPDPSDLY